MHQMRILIDAYSCKFFRLEYIRLSHVNVYNWTLFPNWDFSEFLSWYSDFIVYLLTTSIFLMSFLLQYGIPFIRLSVFVDSVNADNVSFIKTCYFREKCQNFFDIDACK